jgi:polyisoprenyl-phosphate glycosyltransferase
MHSRHLSVIVLIPIYNDWDSAQLLLRDLDNVFRVAGVSPEILLVDDGSTVPVPTALSSAPFAAIRRLDVLELRRNVGHQRAIALGLAFVHSSRPCDVLVVMDGDGEDRSSDVPRLLDHFLKEQDPKIVFAERMRRSEGLVFRFFYRLYRVLHKLLTGLPVKVGNFSILPFSALDTLVVVSDLWNHYAAAVFKSRLPFTTLRTERGSRLAGRPQMHFASLVVHGLSALSVYGDVVGVRMLVLTAALALLSAVGIFLSVTIRLTTTLAIPGWATYTTGILFLICLQLMLISVVFVFTILASRASFTFIPLRDYHLFVKRVVPLGQHEH